VRADYLDTIVWDHITGLLADPSLVRAEIDRRLEQARTSDPATRQRAHLEFALAKATTAIGRMIEAFQEQLLTIDELWDRLPDLRARQRNLRGQLDALDAQLADRDAYLKLADDLEGFLAQLRSSADHADVPERQRVLRLLVKDVLIGPDKITIRHRIPVRKRAATATDPTTPTQRATCARVIYCVGGVTVAPCGDPLSLADHAPSSTTPALSHRWIRRRTRRSAIRCSRNLTSHKCSRLVKKSRMSASSTQFTFLRSIPTTSASSASCGPRPG
jgi:hypothetical protein